MIYVSLLVVKMSFEPLESIPRQETNTLKIVVMFLLLIDPSLATIQVSIMFQGDLAPI